MAETAAGAADPDALDCGRHAWIYSASVEPETQAEQAAWREALPAGYDAVSPIRRPWAFARAQGAMVAEQVGPQGRTLMLRSALGGQVFRTAHRSQTVYHGAVRLLGRPVPAGARGPAPAPPESSGSLPRVRGQTPGLPPPRGGDGGHVLERGGAIAARRGEVVLEGGRGTNGADDRSGRRPRREGGPLDAAGPATGVLLTPSAGAGDPLAPLGRPDESRRRRLGLT